MKLYSFSLLSFVLAVVLFLSSDTPLTEVSPVHPETFSLERELQEDIVPSGKVLIEEFTDYGCSYCRQFHDNTWPKIQEEYLAQYNIEYKIHFFPSNQNPQALEAAKIGYCAQQQGENFEEIHNSLFENYENPVVPEALSDCVQNETTIESINKAKTAARERGVNATPSFFINGRKIVGSKSADVFGRILEEELSKAGIELILEEEPETASGELAETAGSGEVLE